MEIRIRETGDVVTEDEFRAMHPNISLPQQLTEELIDEFGGDVVFEGPQASGGTQYQFSQRDGVELIEGKWFTKYVLGPVFTGPDAEAQEADYIAKKDAQFAQANAERARAELLDTDWADNPSVRNTAFTPHLINTTEWDAYRLALRVIVINKPATVETWPERPAGVWSS